MMRKLFCTAIAAMALQSVNAEDLSFAYEGDAQKRQRLEGIQNSTKPPALKLSKWGNSKSLNLKKLKGKIVVLDFWATWCGPCISSIPHNNEIFEKYKDDVVFIGICHPQGSDKMKKVIKDKGIKYPVAIDKKGDTSKAYKVNGYPDYYIFDKTGKLVVADCSNSKVEKVLEQLLKK